MWYASEYCRGKLLQALTNERYEFKYVGALELETLY